MAGVRVTKGRGPWSISRFGASRALRVRIRVMKGSAPQTMIKVMKGRAPHARFRPGANKLPNLELL